MYHEVTRCLGLIRQFNPLRLVPGALSKARNIVIRRKDVIEDRRSYKEYFASLSAVPSSVHQYDDKVLTHFGSTFSYDSNGVSTNYSGTYSVLTGEKIRSVEEKGNLYFTTSTGIQKFADTAGTAAVACGAPRSLDPSYTLTGSSGFLAASYQCAYRCTIERTDDNDNIIEGYPSTRIVVYNTAGGSRNVILTLYLPTEVTANDVVKFYRTAQVSGTSSDTSGDECALVYSTQPAAADITNGYITFTDSIID